MAAAYAEQVTYRAPRMHWLYLLFGGVVIGTIASIVFPLLLTLSMTLFRVFGARWRPYRFLRRCWGQW
jgi:hypothetical protein